MEENERASISHSKTSSVSCLLGERCSRSGVKGPDGCRSFYCKTTAEAERVIDTYDNDDETQAIYKSLHRLRPALYDTQPDDGRPAVHTTRDKDVMQYLWLLTDADNELRPAGINATDAEIESCRRVLEDMGEVLRLHGWPAPLVADSGNGGHGLYPLWIDVEHKSLVQDVLKVLDRAFSRPVDSDTRVRIDTSVFNPGRVCKLYGTVAHKAMESPDRPWRRSEVLEFPSWFERTKHSLKRHKAHALTVTDLQQFLQAFKVGPGRPRMSQDIGA